MSKKEYRITLRGFFGHLHTVNKHRFLVFKLCCRVGIPFQGLVHDLSKYSPEEFFEGVRYYQGTYSPIRNCKNVNGYSRAWLHHKGRNKHHYEYWYDYSLSNPTPVMPFKYFLELICDSMAAGMTYQGDKWTEGYELTYWHKVRDIARMDIRMKALLEHVYTEIANKGLKTVLKKKYLKKLYDQFMK